MGLVLLVMGLLLLVAGLVANVGTQTAKIPLGGVELKNTAMTAETLTVSWSKVASTLKVYLIVGTPNCTKPSGVVSSGSSGKGVSASFTGTLEVGKIYTLYACNSATFAVVTINYVLSPGLTMVDLIGGAGILFGVLFLLWSRGGPSPPRGAEDFRLDRTSSDAYRRDEFDGLPRRRPTRLREGFRGSHSARPDPLLPTRGPAPLAARAWRGPVRPAPTYELRPRPVETCPGCGRVYTRGRHAACPACGAELSGPSVDRSPQVGSGTEPFGTPNETADATGPASGSDASPHGS